MLVTSIFSFSHNVFKRLLLQGREKSGLCGKGLNRKENACQISNIKLNVHQSMTVSMERLNMLTHSHTMTPFENIVGKKENCFYKQFLLFPTMFSTLSKTEIIIFVTFNLSFASGFNLVWFKILLCGNGLSNVMFKYMWENINSIQTICQQHR